LRKVKDVGFAFTLKHLLKTLGIPEKYVEIVKGNRNGRPCTAIFIYNEDEEEKTENEQKKT